MAGLDAKAVSTVPFWGLEMHRMGAGGGRAMEPKKSLRPLADG